MFVNPWFGQDNAGSAFGDIGRRTHGNAHFGLAKCGRIVNSVSRHAGDMPRGLQVLHNDVLVLRVYLSKTIGARQASPPLYCQPERLPPSGPQHAECWAGPTPCAISLATARASPVSIFTGTPRSRSSAISCLASGRGGSYRRYQSEQCRKRPASGPRATASVR